MKLCVAATHFRHSALRIRLGLSRAEGFHAAALLGYFGRTVLKARGAKSVVSPVVIVNGRIVAVWFLEERAKSFTVDVQPFGKLDAKVHRGIAQEAEALGQFLGERCDAQFS